MFNKDFKYSLYTYVCTQEHTYEPDLVLKHPALMPNAQAVSAKAALLSAPAAFPHAAHDLLDSRDSVSLQTLF